MASVLACSRYDYATGHEVKNFSLFEDDFPQLSVTLSKPPASKKKMLYPARPVAEADIIAHFSAD